MTNSVSSSAPESIASSLEWAGKLKAVGWPQNEYEDFLFWGHNEFHREWFLYNAPEYAEYGGNVIEFLAAPTATELLQKLPVKIDKRYLAITPRNYTGPHVGEMGWLVRYVGEEPVPAIAFDAATLADALAAMYCYLADNQLLP